jgi:hypothetical protein
MKGKEEKLSRGLCQISIFFTNSELLGNIRSSDNSEWFDNVVELEEFSPQNNIFIILEFGKDPLNFTEKCPSFRNSQFTVKKYIKPFLKRGESYRNANRNSWRTDLKITKEKCEQ